MNAPFWSHVHGATVHFPLALATGSGALDAMAFAFAPRPFARDLHVAGFWAMAGGAAGSVPAVVSGLLLTKGALLGHGALRMHHLFAWPAFGLLVGLATWRVCTGPQASRGRFAIYLAVVALTAALVAGAGYWGGELMAAP